MLVSQTPTEGRAVIRAVRAGAGCLGSRAWGEEPQRRGGPGSFPEEAVIPVGG